jgi:hypothetical protein
VKSGFIFPILCTRPSRLGGAKGVRKHFRYRLRRIDFGAAFGNRPEQAHGIHTLMDVLQAVCHGHGTADRHHTIAFRVRGGQAGHQVGAAGSRGDQGHARFARHTPNTTSDEGGVLFVPADNGLDLGVQQRVAHLVDLRARDAEYIFDALCLQTLHQ